MTFKSRVGKQLESAFDPKKRDAVKPQAAFKLNRDIQGDVMPIDCTAEGVVYQPEVDEQKIKD